MRSKAHVRFGGGFRKSTHCGKLVGCLPYFTPMGAQLLFQFCSALHERVALLVTTNLPFGEWIQVLGDQRLTVGLLDRLTANAHIIEFVGDSYRFRQRLDQHRTLLHDSNAGEAP